MSKTVKIYIKVKYYLYFNQTIELITKFWLNNPCTYV